MEKNLNLDKVKVSKPFYWVRPNRGEFIVLKGLSNKTLFMLHWAGDSQFFELRQDSMEAAVCRCFRK